MRLLFEPIALASLDPSLGPLPDGRFLDSGSLVSSCNLGASTEVNIFDPEDGSCLNQSQASPVSQPDYSFPVAGAIGSVAEVLASGQLVIFDIPTGALCIPGSCTVTNEGDFLGTAIIAIIGHFRATPMRMVAGVPRTLDWSATSAINCTLSGVGSVAAIGSVLVNPSIDTDYTLNCTSPGASQEAVTSVIILPQQIFNGGFE